MLGTPETRADNVQVRSMMTSQRSQQVQDRGGSREFASRNGVAPLWLVILIVAALSLLPALAGLAASTVADEQETSSSKSSKNEKESEEVEELALRTGHRPSR